MHVSAKVDYGMRALLQLATAYKGAETSLMKADEISQAQTIPLKFLEGILTELRHAGFVVSQRGAVGGYRLSREPSQISLADVVRALDGPLAAVRGARPEDVTYDGASEHLRDVWVALRASLRKVLENVTLADVSNNKFDDAVEKLLDEPGAWESRPLYATAQQVKNEELAMAELARVFGANPRNPADSFTI
jgi:Rrf2 family protein